MADIEENGGGGREGWDINTWKEYRNRANE
jgi:hypothetical protein